MRVRDRIATLEGDVAQLRASNAALTRELAQVRLNVSPLSLQSNRQLQDEVLARKYLLEQMSSSSSVASMEIDSAEAWLALLRLLTIRSRGCAPSSTLARWRIAI